MLTFLASSGLASPSPIPTAPSPVHVVVDAVHNGWGVFEVLQLVVPVAAVVVTAVVSIWIARRGWEESLTNALSAQKAAARRDRARRAHDELIGVLNPYIGWLDRSIALLPILEYEWKSLGTASTDEESTSILAANQQVVELQATAEHISPAPWQIGDAVNDLPLHSHIGDNLNAMPFLVRFFSDHLAHNASRVLRSHSILARDLEALEKGEASLREWTLFLSEVKQATAAWFARDEADSTSEGPSSLEALRLTFLEFDDGQWTMKKHPTPLWAAFQE